jgi:cytoskeletal protein CcmA (bactofilin family)
MFNKDGMLTRQRRFGQERGAGQLRQDYDGGSSPAQRATAGEVAPPSHETPTSGALERKTDEGGARLIVGPNIKLKGAEITDCETLVVEGRVEASMNSRVIQIAEEGVFCGTAGIDVAEIRGRFEGELTARRRLVIYASGKVSGKIRYGALSVEEGGELSGDVGRLAVESAAGTAGGRDEKKSGSNSALPPEGEARPAATPLDIAAFSKRGNP